MSALDEENNDPAIKSSHTSTCLKSLSFGDPDLWANNANVPFSHMRDKEHPSVDKIFPPH